MKTTIFSCFLYNIGKGEDMNIYADVTKELKTEEFKELDMYLKKDQ